MSSSMRGLAFALAALLSGWTAQAQSGWKAGLAKAVITPREPIWMAGYAARTKPSEGVLADLYVKALALQDEAEQTSVLVSADLLGFTREMSDVIAERCRKQFGLPRGRLLLSATHTHSGPVTGQLLRPAYVLSEPQNEVIRRYTAGLLNNVVDAIGASIRNLSPTRLAFEQGLAGFAVNRRRVRLRNLPGPVDHDVPVLSVRAPDGTLRAVVAGYACHATVLSDYLINGDWPGFAQAQIEKAHPGAVALFVPGCGADANPLPRRSVDLAQKYGQILAAAVEEVLNAKMRPLAGPLNAAFELVDLPFRPPPTREQLQTRLQEKDVILRRQAEHLLKMLDRDGKLPASYPYPVQIWQFGRGLKLIALGGEVVVDYSLRLKAQHGWDDTWVAGYSNDVFAYIPSLRVLNEGGYEGGGAMAAYGQPGPFGAAVEEIIVEKVKDLVERTQPSGAR
jgi:neutral ceramidase